MTILAEMNSYCLQVLSGRIPACKWTKAACRRHLDDLRKAKRQDWSFEFNEAKAQRAVTFTELCPHVKGKWATEKRLLVLSLWQKFIIGSVYGWVHKDYGYRRFKTVYIEVPRKNGKTTLLAPPALYALSADEEEGAEVYSAATVRDQAKIVFNIAKRMVEKAPGMRKRFGVESSAHAIFQMSSDSTFKALSSEGHTFDGFNVSFAAIDELHAHPDRTIYDVLETGTGSRLQPLLWSITTAGSDRAGICYEVRAYLTKIFNKVLMDHDGLGYEVKGDTHEDDSFFGIIYTIDDNDDPMAELSWKKANPNYGISVNPEQLQRMALKAQKMPSAMSNFLTKHLDVWVNADIAWMNMVAWDKCGDPKLDADNFIGQPCYEAVDAASKIDLACRAEVFTKKIEDKPHYYCFVESYLPETKIEEEGNEHYEGWAMEGWITAHSGDVIDLDLIEADVQASRKKYRVQEIAYDPFQMTQMAGHLIKTKAPMKEFKQNPANYTEVMTQMEALVLEGRIHHNDNPVLTWGISNVISHKSGRNKEYMQPTKEKLDKKIDPAVTLMMALSRAILAAEPKKSVYEERGVRVL